VLRVVLQLEKVDGHVKDAVLDEILENGVAEARLAGRLAEELDQVAEVLGNGLRGVVPARKHQGVQQVHDQHLEIRIRQYRERKAEASPIININLIAEPELRARSGDVRGPQRDFEVHLVRVQRKPLQQLQRGVEGHDLRQTGDFSFSVRVFLAHCRAVRHVKHLPTLGRNVRRAIAFIVL